jgi:hypothetical protein
MTAKNRQVTVVIDGLDESPERAIIHTELVGPLLHHTSNGRRMVRLVIGLHAVVDTEADPVGLLSQRDPVCAGADIRACAQKAPTPEPTSRTTSIDS